MLSMTKEAPIEWKKRKNPDNVIRPSDLATTQADLLAGHYYSRNRYRNGSQNPGSSGEVSSAPTTNETPITWKRREKPDNIIRSSDLLLTEQDREKGRHYYPTKPHKRAKEFPSMNGNSSPSPATREVTDPLWGKGTYTKGYLSKHPGGLGLAWIHRPAIEEREREAPSPDRAQAGHAQQVKQPLKDHSFWPSPNWH